MSIAFLFPGQGAQHPGMLHNLPKHNCTESILNQASEVLKQDVYSFDSEAALDSTVAVQLSLFIAGVAAATALAAEGVIPVAVAGLSVGAYSAAVICKSLTFTDGLAIVQKRAQLMENQFPSGYGMSAIVGLTEKKVSELVSSAHEPSEPVFVSNINAPTQITIVGALRGLEKVETAALKYGARKAERLHVAVPSHCPLFQSAAGILQEGLSKISIQNPAIPYVGNVRARPLRTGQGVAEDLANNIANGVRWHDSVSVLVELGTNLFVEMNPGEVLSRLGTESFPGLRFIALEKSSLAYVSRLAHSRKDFAI
jgi:malonate decarboxylase epsilon subunit